MAKGFARRAGRANGKSPFSDDDLAELLRKEEAMNAFNENRLDDIPDDLAMFVGGMANLGVGEPRSVSWDRYLAQRERIAAARPANQSEQPLQTFPRTLAELQRVVQWRKVSSVGAL